MFGGKKLILKNLASVCMYISKKCIILHPVSGLKQKTDNF